MKRTRKAEPQLVTLKGSVIQRAKGGVGKRMGEALYLHRDYVEPSLLVNEEPFEFPTTIVKLAKTTVTFVECPGFDDEPEPRIHRVVTVHRQSRGLVKTRRDYEGEMVYHHKWLFVKDDYTGFDVAESIERSRQWLALEGVDMRRIGRLDYWEREVVPRIGNK